MRTKAANINIEGNGMVFHYIAECQHQYTTTNDPVTFITNNHMDDYSDDNDIIFINKDSSNYVKNYNRWYALDELMNDFSHNEILGEQYHLSRINLYFPTHSVDTYENGVKYSVTINTWICGKKIILGSYIISRHDLLACDRPKKFMNLEYYECINFDIVDPWDIMYSDTWMNWRRIYCSEPEDVVGVNSVGSILCISIHPIIENESGEYIKSSNFIGGQNSINIGLKSDDYMSLNLSCNINNKYTYLDTEGYPGELISMDKPSFECQISFNEVYNGNLKEYLEETYNIKTCCLKFELVIGNDTDIYGICSSNLIKIDDSTKLVYSFDKESIYRANDNFKNWVGYKEGIYVVASVGIINEDDESIISLLSNRLPLTQNIYSYFVNKEFTYFTKKGQFSIQNILRGINIDKLDMNLYNINAVNKIINNIVYTQKNDDVKNNIIQPVFFRVAESSEITIHPEVIENICINLDRYKSQVDRFILKVEGVNFHEIGRNSAGSIFKIVGNSLPKNNNSGLYYILSQDEELITSGKYNYVV